MVTEDSPEPIEGSNDVSASSADPQVEVVEEVDPGEVDPALTSAAATASATASATATKAGLTIVAIVILVLLLLLTILIPVFAGPASEGSQPGIDIGDCEGLATSSDFSPGTMDPTVSTGVYVAQLQGSADYFGALTVSVDTPRDGISGQISVNTPPLFPAIPVGGGWGPTGEETFDEGTRTWDIPTWAPRNVVFTVSGSHSEAGANCSGFVLVKLDGGAFDSPLIWIPIVLSILLVLIFLLAVKNGKPILAGVVGLFAGLSLGITEVFLGAQQLDGPAPTVLAAAFLVGGVIAATAQKKAMAVS